MPRTLDVPLYRSRSTSKHTMDAATVARVAPKAIRDALEKRLPPIMDALGRLDRALDRRNNRIIDARAKAIVDRLRAEATMHSTGIVSATAGYVRDAAGNRVRPMTPADMQQMADEHYGRAR